ncbi:hypothetical protein QYQ99_26710 [Comamonas testosteroni]|uniref:hypothetical protein n=1 Tax=Comamonas testosteroni TaxID=285 RepID=UPI00265D7946|nr:hypothetical protein [Comamonas testosteroni]WKL15864.1 hypothetical protein QYQ99_26710 [Comamonas testosteroni]
MFQTNDANKHPVSQLYNKGTHVWTGVELQLRRIWFMIDYQWVYREGSDELSFTDTVLLSTAEDVLSFASQHESILSVYLMTPILGGGWQKDLLTGIWEAADPADPRLMTKIYAKVDGSHHVDSLPEATAAQPKDWEQLLAFPVYPAKSVSETNELH